MYSYKKTKSAPFLPALLGIAILALGQTLPIASAKKKTKITLHYGKKKRKEITLLKKNISVKKLIDIAWEALLVGMDKKNDESAIRTYLDIDEDEDLSQKVLRACVVIERNIDDESKTIEYILPLAYVLNLEENMFKEFNLDKDIPLSILAVNYNDIICSWNDPHIPKKYHVSDDILVQQAADYSIKNLIEKYRNKPKKKIGKNFTTKELPEKARHVPYVLQNDNAPQKSSEISNGKKIAILFFILFFLYIAKNSLSPKKKKKRRRRRKSARKRKKKQR